MATSSSQPIAARVNRAFWMEGKVHNVGEKISVPPALASELYAAGKIERADMEPSELHKQALLDIKMKADRKSAGVKVGKAAA
jgi:hypothetical protein